MLDVATIERLAARLDEAERTKTLIPMFSKEYPDFAIADRSEEHTSELQSP